MRIAYQFRDKQPEETPTTPEASEAAQIVQAVPLPPMPEVVVTTTQDKPKGRDKEKYRAYMRDYMKKRRKKNAA